MVDLRQDLQKLNLAQLLAQVSRLVGGRMRAKMESLGLQRAHGTLLVQLWHGDGIPQSELARAMHIRPATATHTLQRMERNGWIRRVRDEADQRIVRVYLTARARDLHEAVRANFRELDAEMTAALTEQERTCLHRSLLKVRQRLTEGMAGEVASAHGLVRCSQDPEESR